MAGTNQGAGLGDLKYETPDEIYFRGAATACCRTKDPIAVGAGIRDRGGNAAARLDSHAGAAEHCAAVAKICGGIARIEAVVVEEVVW